MAGTNPDLALDLDTLVERLHIRIRSKAHPDGKLYDLRTPDELGIIEHQRFQASARDAYKLREVDPEKLTAKQAKVLTHALHTAVEIVLPDLEGDVKDELSDQQLARIAETFAAQLPDQDGEEPGPPPTGGE